MESKSERHTLALLSLAMPIIGMTVSRMLMGFIDFIMVSRLGTEAQAAISPATILVFALACLGMGAAQSIQTFVSQADGRGEPEQGGAYAWQTYYLAIACGIATLPFVLTSGAWVGGIASLAHHDPGVAKLELDYIAIGLWSVAPATICAGLNGFFMGVQRARIGLISVIVSLVVNVIGNYLLIFGKFGFPEMGIAGAALATVIGWAARAAVLTWAMLLPSIDARFHTRRSMALSWEKLRGILKIGGPTSVQWLIDIGSWVVFMAVIVPPYGTEAMAASNVVLQFMHLSFMPAIGIGIALCTQTGFAIGEGRPDVAALKARVAIRVTGAYMGVIGLLFLFGRYPLMRLMVVDGDTAVLDMGAQVLIWAAIFQVFDAMGITYMNALRGAGDTRVPAIMVTFCCWGIFIGGGLLMSRYAPGLGIHGPWMMCTLYISVLGLLLLWRYKLGHWRNIKLFDQSRAGSAAQLDLDPTSDEAPQTDLAAACADENVAPLPGAMAEPGVRDR